MSTLSPRTQRQRERTADTAAGSTRSFSCASHLFGGFLSLCALFANAIHRQRIASLLLQEGKVLQFRFRLTEWQLRQWSFARSPRESGFSLTAGRPTWSGFSRDQSCWQPLMTTHLRPIQVMLRLGRYLTTSPRAFLRAAARARRDGRGNRRRVRRSLSLGRRSVRGRGFASRQFPVQCVLTE